MRKNNEVSKDVTLLLFETYEVAVKYSKEEVFDALEKIGLYQITLGQSFNEDVGVFMEYLNNEVLIQIPSETKDTISTIVLSVVYVNGGTKETWDQHICWCIDGRAVYKCSNEVCDYTWLLKE